MIAVKSVLSNVLKYCNLFDEKDLKSGLVFLFLFVAYFIYSMIVYTNGTEHNVLLSEKAVSGKALFQEHNCIACHQVYGLGGLLGADLTKIISTKGKGEEYARVFLKYGTDRMPQYHLQDSEIDNIIEYLKCIDQTANTYKQL
jgi:nitric oxide reductase subunit C